MAEDKLVFPKNHELPPVGDAFKEANQKCIERVKGLGEAMRVYMKSVDATATIAKPSVKRALMAACCVEIGQHVMYKGKVYEVTDECFSVDVECDSVSVYESHAVEFDGITLSGNFVLGGDRVLQLNLSPREESDGFNAHHYYDNRKYLKAATADDMGYSLPTIDQVKAWMRKLLGSCKEDELGVNMRFYTVKGERYQPGHKWSDQKTTPCAFLDLRLYRKYDYKVQDYENMLLARARLAKVASNMKDYAERRGCVAEIITSEDGNQMELHFHLVKKARAS